MSLLAEDITKSFFIKLDWCSANFIQLQMHTSSLWVPHPPTKRMIIRMHIPCFLKPERSIPRMRVNCITTKQERIVVRMNSLKGVNRCFRKSNSLRIIPQAPIQPFTNTTSSHSTSIPRKKISNHPKFNESTLLHHLREVQCPSNAKGSLTTFEGDTISLKSPKAAQGI